MNGAYHGPPYTQPHPAYPSPAPVNGPTGPGIPGQYGYPMHPGPFHPAAYNPYPQYPQQMVMYARPPEAAHPVNPAPSPASDDGTSSRVMTPAQAVAQQSSPVVDVKKRTKTQRACDSCRSRKIRCDILADAESPTCQHCKQYGFECTFFLPITETRFKKKKVEEESPDNEKRTRRTSSPRADTTSEPRVSVFGMYRLVLFPRFLMKI
jgi:hypothetical protein